MPQQLSEWYDGNPVTSNSHNFARLTFVSRPLKPGLKWRETGIQQKSDQNPCFRYVIKRCKSDSYNLILVSELISRFIETNRTLHRSQQQELKLVTLKLLPIIRSKLLDSLFLEYDCTATIICVNRYAWQLHIFSPLGR